MLESCAELSNDREEFSLTQIPACALEAIARDWCGPDSAEVGIEKSWIQSGRRRKGPGAELESRSWLTQLKGIANIDLCSSQAPVTDDAADAVWACVLTSMSCAFSSAQTGAQ